MQNSVAAMENSMVVPQKIKNENTIQSSSPNSEHISRRTGSRIMKKYLHTHVYSSVIYNSQEVEATQVSTDR